MLLIRSLSTLLSSRVWTIAVVLGSALVGASVQSQSIDPRRVPSTAPQLRIDPGAHVDRIDAVATDARGRFVVTASKDKTARLWDAASGHLLHTFRVPIADGYEGQLKAVAISPDGSTVAVAGFTGFTWRGGRYAIYVYDRSTGNMTGAIGTSPGVIVSLAFSQSGRYLAAGLGEGGGLHLYDTRNPAAPPYVDRGYDTRQVTYSSEGWIATSSKDGKIRTYSVAKNGTMFKQRQAQMPNGMSPYGVAFSPQLELAVGDSNSRAVYVLSLPELALKSKYTAAALEGQGAHWGLVAWSADGQSLYAGGYSRKGDRQLVRRWAVRASDNVLDIPTVRSTVFALTPLATGGILIAGGEVAWGVLGADGSWTEKAPPATADFRGIRSTFAISPNASVIQFGFGWRGAAPARFELATRRLTPTNAAAPAMVSPKTTGLDVEIGEDGSLKLDGKLLDTGLDDTTRSFAIASDSKSFVVAGDSRLRRFDASGNELWGIYGRALGWGVAISADDQLVVVANGDGTVRWHRMSDGQELLALFPHADRVRWILWTPSGYYDASVAGEDLIGWHINRDVSETPDYFPASRMREQFFRPEVIDRILVARDERVAAGGMNARVAASLPPVVDVLSDTQITTPKTKVRVRVSARTANDAKVTGWRIRSDGLGASPFVSLGGPNGTNGAQEFEVAIPPRDTELYVFAENRNGYSTPAVIRINYTGPKSESLASGRLLVLAVGVSTYANPSITPLPAGKKEATDFAETMKLQRGRRFREVVSRALVDDDATVANVRKALVWLKEQTGPDDTAILYWSSHGGTSSDKRMYYLSLNDTELSEADLRSTLADIRGTTIVFLDACESGTMGETSTDLRAIKGAINRMSSAESGVVVFSSSGGDQSSYTGTRDTYGIYTDTLIRGLKGAAAITPERSSVTYGSLHAFLREVVNSATKGKQTPVSSFPTTLNNKVLVYTAN